LNLCASPAGRPAILEARAPAMKRAGPHHACASLCSAGGSENARRQRAVCHHRRAAVSKVATLSLVVLALCLPQSAGSPPTRPWDSTADLMVEAPNEPDLEPTTTPAPGGSLGRIPAGEKPWAVPTRLDEVSMEIGAKIDALQASLYCTHIALHSTVSL
jgi:hypothetical protein